MVANWPDPEEGTSWPDNLGVDVTKENPTIYYGFVKTTNVITQQSTTKIIFALSDSKNAVPGNVKWATAKINASTLSDKRTWNDADDWILYLQESFPLSDTQGTPYTPTTATIYYHTLAGTLTSKSNSLSGTQLSAVHAFNSLYSMESVQTSIPSYYEQEVENPEYTAKKKKADEAKAAYDAVADDMPENAEQYKNIEVKGSFTFPSGAEDILTEWPAGYTLNGNGNCIKTSKYIFDTNNGLIENLANPLGSIAKNNYGVVDYSLTRRTNGDYRVYSENSEFHDYTVASVEDVIYNMRNTEAFPFGYNVTSGEVVPKTEDTKLYQAQYAKPKKGATKFKLNIKSNNLVYDWTNLGKSSLEALTENAIVYLEDYSNVTIAAAEKTPNIAVKNKVVGDDNDYNYTCYNTKLSDAQNAQEFYIPFNFTSKKVTYGRSFDQKYAAVCFPFSLTTDMQEDLGIEAAYQFKEVNPETGVMWFSPLGATPANEPCLIVFKDEIFEENKTPGSIFNAYYENEDLSFDKTPLTGLVATNTNGQGMFYGTYKYSVAKDLLLGANSTDAIYGIQKGELVKTKETAKFKAFRSYIRTLNIPTTVAAPSYKIGLLDEDGNELSTVIETVSGEIVSGFKAKGGDNAIEIITDKACPVKVYALNGALVKSTRVEAGVTSLPVKAGMYVVNGAKVIVK